MNALFLIMTALNLSPSTVKERLEWLLHSPLTGLPQYHSEVPPTEASAQLGRLLFYDRRLSRDGSIACASCHQVEHAFSNPTALSTGIGGMQGQRKAPVLLNKAFLAPQFWDGRATTLEVQALGPLLHPNEMGTTEEAIVRTLTAISGYSIYFTQAFGDAQVTVARVVHALSDFERTLLSGDSKWDRWRNDSSSVVYTPEETRGYELFLDRDCKKCHTPPFFTDNLFHNTGIGYANGIYKDEGRFGFTKLQGLQKPEEMGAFKTPTLRNVTAHAPHMHDGSVGTLEEVINFYNRGGNQNPQLDRKILPLGLHPEEKAALLAFLKTLEGTGFEDSPPVPTEFPQ